MLEHKICLFCGNKAETKDHTPSKNLLEKPYPNNLHTVDCCKKCNNSFSRDEEYFLNVLVEISSNPVLLAKKQYGGNVFRARERSARLKREIEDSFIKSETGKIYFTSDNNRIKRVIEKMLRDYIFTGIIKLRN